MKENTEVPVQEDYSYFFRRGKIESPRQRILVIIAGFLLVIAMSIMIAFNFQSLNEVKHLKQEIEDLKLEMAALHSLVGNLKYNEEEYVDDTEDSETKTETSNSGPDYSYDDDYEDYDENEEDDIGNDIIINRANLHRLLTGDQFTKDAKDPVDIKREKRNVIGYTEDGVPINSESITEAKRKNITSRRHRPRQHPSTSPSIYYSSQELTPSGRYETTPTPRPIYSRRSRVMHQEDKSKAFRQVIKKSQLRALKSMDEHHSSRESSEAEFTVVRDDQIGGIRTRHRHLESFNDSKFPKFGRMRPLPTAHFNGDTSKYVVGQHVNFNGNGHLRHPQRTYVDWIESSWFNTLGMDKHFSLSEGVLTIKESGLYFVYAQIYYLDEHDINGFRVYKNEDTLLQCTTTTHSVDRVMKGNTCYTASADYLHEGDRISLRDISDSRYSLFEPGKSFFGIIKLGDVKVK